MEKKKYRYYRSKNKKKGYLFVIVSGTWENGHLASLGNLLYGGLCGTGVSLPFHPHPSPLHGERPSSRGQVLMMRCFLFAWGCIGSLRGLALYTPSFVPQPDRSWQPGGFFSRSSGRRGGDQRLHPLPALPARFPDTGTPGVSSLSTVQVLWTEGSITGRLAVEGLMVERLHCILHCNFHSRLYLTFAEWLGI